MASTYEQALEPKQVGDALVQQVHHHLESDVPVVYFFMDGAKKYSFYARARQIKKGGSMVAFMTEQYLQQQGYDTAEAEVFRIIEVAKPLWNALTPSQRMALIDHELCHFGPGGKRRKHDLEEFREVVERHGFYLPDVKDFAEAVKKRKEQEEAEKAA